MEKVEINTYFDYLMKYYLVLFSFFALISCHNDINDKSKRNNKWAWWTDAKTGESGWIPLSDKPTWKNGKYTKFYVDGKIFSKGTIKDGKKVDTIYFYDPKGLLYYYGICKLDSTRYYYIQDGYTKIFWANGKLNSEGIIRDHKISGKWTEYFRNGKINVVDNETNDTGWMVHFYEHGGLKDSCYQAGNTVYPIKMWYENGQISLSATWKDYNFNGEYDKYYENGQIQGSTEMIDGNKNGALRYWYSSGQLHGIENFKHGIADGDQIRYFENGQEEGFCHFVDGKLDGEGQMFDEKGKLVADRLFKDGVQIKKIK